MCFSAQSSLTMATMLTVVGGLTLTRSPSKLRPIACIPLAFALQQALEGIIWVTFNYGDMTSALHYGAVYGFIAIAGIFWPLWIPGTLYVLETNDKSKRVLLSALWGGGLVSIWCMLGYILMGREVQIVNHHLSYPYLLSTFGNLPASFINVIDHIMIILYMLVTAGSPLISSLKSVWILGVLVGLGWVIALVFYYMSFGSLWCYFAAIASLAIYYIIRVNSFSKP